MQKTLMIMPKLYKGGAETQFRMLFNELRKEQTVYIFAMDKSENPNSEIFKKKYASYVKEHYLVFKKGIFSTIEQILFLTYYVIKYRLKGCENIFIYETYLLVIVPLLKILKYNILYSERNTGKHAHHFLFYFISKCNFIGTNSLEAAEILREKVKAHDVVVVNNAVVLANKEYVYHRRDNEVLKILVPARIFPIKNQLLVVKTLGDLYNYNVHFAGEVYDEEYKNLLIREISKCKFPNNFTFDGFIDDMNSYYHDFDIILLPSLEEGTSNVILECFANYVPCLVSNIKMNVRVQRNEDYVFLSNNSASLLDRINKFKSFSESKINHDLKMNYTYVQENYSIKKMVDTYIKYVK